LGIVTIGQTPRTDVVPEMAELLGPDVEILERGALDGLEMAAISALAPAPGDEVLITRLRGGAPVFVGQRRIAPRVQACLADLDRHDVAVSALLCTGVFPEMAAAAPLLHPDRLLLGALRAVSWPGRLGVLTPSASHVPQTAARWRGCGYEPVVAVLSPYEDEDEGRLALAVEALGGGEAGLVVLDCMGYRRKVKHEIRALLGVPVLQANLLLARVAAELLA
jgi:protein AroM